MPVYDAPKSTVPGVRTVKGKWVGGGAAANCTKASTDVSKGIVSVNYNAATGKYRITFTDAPGFQVCGGNIVIHRAAAGTPVLAVITDASYSIANKTLDFQCFQITAGAYAAVDLLTSDKVIIDLDFATIQP